MAQQTSELWKTLLAKNGTEREYAFKIDGVWYGQDQIVEHSYDGGLFEKFGIGSASVGQLTLSFFAESVPKGAKIERFIRLKNGEDVSEWLPKGVFYTNRRASDDGYWTLEAFDTMRKAETVWEPDQNLTFPMTMPAAAAEFARIMGVEIDPRTELNNAYTIDYPTDELTIRDELAYIAAAHGGNWIMTDTDKLYLVPLLSAPPETHYLVDESYYAITFGGVRILV